MSNQLMRAKLGHRKKPTTSGITPVKVGVPHRTTVKKGHLGRKTA